MSRTCELMLLGLGGTYHILGRWLDQSVPAYTLTSAPYEPPYIEKDNGVHI